MDKTNQETLNILLDKAKLYPNQNQQRRSDTAINGQHPKAAILCCSDSRVIPEEIFDCSIGDLFVIRTAGNTLGPNELASFEYAYHHLGISLFIVLGHTHCGAVGSALEGHHGALMDTIREHIHDEKDPIEASKKNTLAVASELVQEFKGQTDVVALIYDIHEGMVEPL